jgi:hypothetical protein
VVGRHLRRYWTCHRALPLQCQSHRHTARHLFPSIPEHQQALPRLQSHLCHPNEPVPSLLFSTYSGPALGGGKVGHRPGPPKTMGPHPKYKCTSNMPYMIHSDSVSQRRIGETNRRSRVGCDRLLSPNPACVPPPPWTGRRLDAFARRQLVRSFLCLNRQIAISLIATTAHSSVPESLLLLACCWTPELDRLCSKFQCEFTAFQRSS